MEKQLSNKDVVFKLESQSDLVIKGNVISNGRFVIGRAESCDITIKSGIISAIHAVLEITPNGIKLFDMNSKNGSFVNGNKVIVTSLSPNDLIAFGNVNLKLIEFSKQSDLPTPILPSIDVVKTDPQKAPELEVKHESMPEVVFPLSVDNGADISEYIFEDANNIYPIFKYEHSKQAVEVIVLYKDSVFSVDYLPEKETIYKISGVKKKKDQLEFAYLGKKDVLDFVEVNKGNCVVHTLPSYEISQLTDNGLEKQDAKSFNLQGNDIIVLQNGDIEIFIRKVPTPPLISPPPFFRRDEGLKKIVGLLLLFILSPLVALNFYKVDKELDKEKDPERIVRILYKKKLIVSKTKAVEKTVKKKKKKQKTPMKKVVKKKSEPKVKQKEPQKVVKKVVKKTGNKTAKKVQQVKKVKKPAPKAPKIAKKKASAAPSKSKSKTRTRKAARPSPNKGIVDAYKSFDFKSSVSSVMAKGGTLKGAKTASKSADSLRGTTVGGGVESNLKKADAGTEVGSLTGSTIGKISTSKGVEGMSAKRGVLTAGIPSETVILGSMDPNDVRRLLREHIPQFRYCYQKQLDQTRSVSGILNLNFTIGSSGYVSRAGVSSKSKLSGSVRSCVVGVLKGIKFPRPLGGGKVDVKQPMNFYAKQL